MRCRLSPQFRRKHLLSLTRLYFFLSLSLPWPCPLSSCPVAVGVQMKLEFLQRKFWAATRQVGVNVTGRCDVRPCWAGNSPCFPGCRPLASPLMLHCLETLRMPSQPPPTSQALAPQPAGRASALVPSPSQPSAEGHDPESPPLAIPKSLAHLPPAEGEPSYSTVQGPGSRP